MQEQIRARTLGNLRVLDQVLARYPAVTRLEVEAGWYAVLRVPAYHPTTPRSGVLGARTLGRDEELAVRLVEERGVSVHPGYFFGFSGEGWLVVSLLGPEAEFRTGIEQICAAVGD
jgi:alanine-synthesizing transaminase